MLHLPLFALPWVLLEVGAVPFEAQADCMPTARALCRRDLPAFAAAWAAALHFGVPAGQWPWAGTAAGGAVAARAEAWAAGAGAPAGFGRLVLFGALAAGLAATGHVVRSALDRVVLAGAGIVAVDDDMPPLDPMVLALVKAAKERQKKKDALAKKAKAAKRAAKAKAAREEAEAEAEAAVDDSPTGQKKTKKAKKKKKASQRRGRSRSPRKGTNSKSPSVKRRALLRNTRDGRDNNAPTPGRRSSARLKESRTGIYVYY